MSLFFAACVIETYVLQVLACLRAMLSRHRHATYLLLYSQCDCGAQVKM